MPDVLHTTPDDWKYVSEGGATIVFSYNGQPHPDFDGTVLRLRKTSVRSATHPSAPVEGEEEPDDPTIEFQTKCMERLIPPEHLPRLETIHLNRAWLEKLVEIHDRVRPEARRAKDTIDLNKKKGVLATDLVGGKWMAVEIKVCLVFKRNTIYYLMHYPSRNGRSCLLRCISRKRANTTRRIYVDFACIRK